MLCNSNSFMYSSYTVIHLFVAVFFVEHAEKPFDHCEVDAPQEVY